MPAGYQLGPPPAASAPGRVSRQLHTSSAPCARRRWSGPPRAAPRICRSWDAFVSLAAAVLQLLAQAPLPPSQHLQAIQYAQLATVEALCSSMRANKA